MNFFGEEGSFHFISSDNKQMDDDFKLDTGTQFNISMEKDCLIAVDSFYLEESNHDEDWGRWINLDMGICRSKKRYLLGLLVAYSLGTIFDGPIRDDSGWLKCDELDIPLKEIEKRFSNPEKLKFLQLAEIIFNS